MPGEDFVGEGRELGADHRHRALQQPANLGRRQGFGSGVIGP
jgi:hypothetical protein